MLFYRTMQEFIFQINSHLYMYPEKKIPENTS